MSSVPQAIGAVRRSARLGRRRSRAITKVGLIMPAMAMFLVFYIAPIIAGVVLSLFRWDGLQPPVWVGFENYELLLRDSIFVSNVRVTLISVGVTLAVTLPMAVLLALCLSGRGRLLGLFRTLLFLPTILPLAAIALMWSEIFNPAGGMANEVLEAVGLAPVNWLGEPNTAMWSLILVTVWSMFGIHMVIQLSALSTIPAELREAARLETPSSWRTFRHVVLPLLRDALTVSTILIITGTFVVYTALSLLMTRGGPVHATETLGLRAFIEGYSSLDFGRANAATVITMLITITLVGIALLIGSRRRVEY